MNIAKKASTALATLTLVVATTLCSCGYNDSTEVLNSTESYSDNNAPSSADFFETKEETSNSTLNNTLSIKQQEYVYQKIDEILSLDTYNKGAIEEKIELIEPVLKELKKGGYIKEYYFELELEKPNIHYAFPDGSKNTIALVDISIDEN